MPPSVHSGWGGTNAQLILQNWCETPAQGDERRLFFFSAKTASALRQQLAVYHHALAEHSLAALRTHLGERRQNDTPFTPISAENTVVFLYSGGSAAMYYKWRNVLSDNITLRPLEPAGRGTRIRQPLRATMADAVADLYQQFAKSDTGGEYAIFGHNLGGIMAFELVHYILEQGHDMPRAVFFSGCRPPDRISHDKILHTLPDQAFMQEIVKLGGTPVDVFRNRELMAVFTPIIKNDYRLYEQYVFQAKTRTLTCPVVLFHGDADSLVMQDELPAWDKFTTQETRTMIFPGADHFFVDKHFEQVVQCVNQTFETLEVTG